jgi:hypothetical protein
LPPGTGPASSAAAKTRRPLPKNGERRAGFTGRPTPRRWTTCCTPNAYEGELNACTGTRSTSCPTAHLQHSTVWLRHSQRHSPALDARGLPCS